MKEGRIMPKAGTPTPVEQKHYGALIGKIVKDIEYQEFEGDTLATLVFTDGTKASVMQDPEGNGAGWLFIDLPTVCGRCQHVMVEGENYYKTKAGPVCSPCFNGKKVGP